MILLQERMAKGLVKKTYRDVYAQWMVVYRSSVRESTLNKTLGIFKRQILPYFGNFPIDEIDVLHCQNVVNKWASNFKQIKMYLSYAKIVFNYAIKRKLIKDNPFDFVILPRSEVSEQDKPANFYDKTELVEFFKALNSGTNDRAKVFFRVLAFTGMRKGEALALTWNDIDFGVKTINISKTVALGLQRHLITQTPKTVNGFRTIDIDEITAKILKSLHTESKGNKQLIFPNKNNVYTNPSQPRTWLYQVYKKHPELKRISVHGFRHTHASLLFESGATMKEVQERLGHGSIQTTMNIYTHVTKSARKEAATKFSQYVNF